MTRMWMGNPKTMCRQHLLGEHKEIPQLVGTLKKGFDISGFIKNNLVEIEAIIARHNELVEEMLFRGYNHKSPINTSEELSCFTKYLSPFHKQYKVNVESSNLDRASRCVHCKQLMENFV